jgi:hypothetical protein
MHGAIEYNTQKPKVYYSILALHLFSEILASSNLCGASREGVPAWEYLSWSTFLGVPVWQFHILYESFVREYPSRCYLSGSTCLGVPF